MIRLENFRMAFFITNKKANINNQKSEVILYSSSFNHRKTSVAQSPKTNQGPTICLVVVYSGYIHSST